MINDSPNLSFENHHRKFFLTFFNNFKKLMLNLLKIRYLNFEF